MAFIISIRAKLTPEGPQIAVEPSGWSRVRLIEQLPFEKVIDESLYLDYVLEVDKQQLIAIYNDQQEFMSFFYDDPSEADCVAKERRQIQDLLDKMNEESEVKIVIYEWESGL
jgi:hypothetical protein